MARGHLFVEVILPRAFDGQTFTYRCDHYIEIGKRVLVTLQSKKLIGVVVRCHEDEPLFFVKPIEEVLDDAPVMSSLQVDFINWIGTYYLTTVGAIYRLSIPSGIKNANYSPPTRIAYRLKNKDIEAIEGMLVKRKAALRALRVVLSFGEDVVVAKRQLFEAGVTESGLKGLLEFGVIEQCELVVNVYKDISSCNENTESVAKPKLYIGQGVENSIELVKMAIERARSIGRICFVLCPNNYVASSVAQMIDDEDVVQYHARVSERQRAENYLRILNSPNSVSAVVGSWLGLLLPYKEIGEIVVLDESAFSYKSDRTPRLNGRDCAVMLASMTKANLTLTSIVPSLESYANAKFGRWELVDLRNNQAKIMILEKGKGKIFSTYMLNEMEWALNESKQVIVFQNRRGFAGAVVCRRCGYVPICPHCNVTLTFHRFNNTLMCHHCNYVIGATKVCQGCNSTEMELQGMGTERVEEELAHFFPDAKIARIDSDVVARREAFGEIKEDIESSKADIIVATQLILNGLKIPNAALCVIVNADNMFMSTDFRTSERIVSTLSQLRNLVSMELIIQTRETQNPILKVLEGDYLDFYDREIEERGQFNYPPLARLICVRMICNDSRALQGAAFEVEKKLLPIFKERLNPIYEPFAERRINGEMVLEVSVKLRKDHQQAYFKEKIQEVVKGCSAIFGSVKFYIDVDPL